MMFTITGGNSVAGYQLERAFGLGMGACIYFTSQHLAYPRTSPLYSVTGSMSSCVLKSFVWRHYFLGVFILLLLTIFLPPLPHSSLSTEVKIPLILKFKIDSVEEVEGKITAKATLLD